ncbi:MAG: tetratricopeptide repeat protein [Steroidobacteraceae bacterium]
MQRALLTGKLFRSSVLATMLAALAIFAVTTQPAQAQKKATVSKALAKPLKAAQDAMGKKDWPTARAKLREAEAMSGRSDFDDFTINEMIGYVAVRQGQYGEAAEALEKSFNSPHFDKAQTASRLNALSQLFYQVKNYGKSIEYGNRAIRGGTADEDMYTLVGQAYYVTKDYKNTIRLLGGYTSDVAKRGRTPKEQHLQLVLSSCINLKDNACVTDSLEKLVAYYPKEDYWQNLVASLFASTGNDDRLLLNVFRLAVEVNAMRRPEDYTEMAQLAIEKGSPGEAQSVLETAFARKVFTDKREIDKNQRLLDQAKKLAATDKASLKKVEAEAAGAKSGEAAVRVGQAYLSYGDYAKASALIQQGIGKGGIKNAEETQLLLGIAELKNGQKADAIKAFKAINGSDSYKRIGNLWALHAG